MDNTSVSSFYMTLKFITSTDVTFISLIYFIVRVRIMLNVKWQERTTTTGILEVSWPISIKAMFIGDICGDTMTERYPGIFGMASFIA